jgi:WD40 repeat protein
MSAFENTNILKLIFSNYTPHYLRTLQTGLNNTYLCSIRLSLLTDNHIINSLFRAPYEALTIEDLNSIQLLTNDNLVTLSENRTVIKIWELNTYKCIRTLNPLVMRACTVCLLPNDNLAVGYENGTIDIFDNEDNYIAKSKRIQDDSNTCLLLLGNGKLASGAATDPNQRYCSIVIWDVEDSMKDIKVLEGHSGAMINLINLSERYFVSFSRDYTMKVWDIKDNYNCVWKYTCYRSGAISLLASFTKSYCRLKSNNMDIFGAWEKCLELVDKLNGEGKSLDEVLYLSSNHIVIQGEEVQIFDFKSLKCVRKIQNKDYSINKFQVLKDYRIVTKADDKINVWTY